MIIARSQGNKAEEARSQQAAIDKLKSIAVKLRGHAGEATEPKLKAALTASADNLDRVAADPANFTSLDSLDKVSQTNEKYATATADIADYCA